MTLLDAFSHLFIPHDSNNHRPRVLHPQAFLAYIVFILFFGFGIRLVSNAAPQILGIATNISVEQLLDSTNKQREDAGLSPLKLNSNLSKAAYNKAQNMITQDYWAHFGPNGESPWDFITSSGYSYSFAGENLAKDFDDSSSVVEAWMNSPTHRDNILKTEYRDIGFAVVNGNLNGHETTLVVQMFGVSNSRSQPDQVLIDSDSTVNLDKDVKESSKSNIAITENGSQKENEIIVAGVSKFPALDVKTLNKSVTILLLGLITIVLVLDGILIWQRKTIRISGHNIAHVLFILAFMTAIWLTTTGSIR